MKTPDYLTFQSLETKQKWDRVHKPLPLHRPATPEEIRNHMEGIPVLANQQAFATFTCPKSHEAEAFDLIRFSTLFEFPITYMNVSATFTWCAVDAKGDKGEIILTAKSVGPPH